MGITRGGAKLLGITLKDKGLSGSVITFGVMGIQSQYDELRKIFDDLEFQYRKLGSEEIVIDNLTQFKDTVHQNILFKMIGFTKIDSIDYFPDEKPAFTLDLNKPLPADLLFKYDLVYDGGTTEHCFDIKQVLSNAVTLVKEGGMIIHHLPMNKAIDHGFYQFSPTLFFDFYGANGFVDMEMKIHYQNAAKESYFTYDPQKDRPLPFSFGYDDVHIFFSARKKHNQEIINPIQNSYRRTFGDKKISPQKKEEKSFWKLMKRKILKSLFPKNHIMIKKKIDYLVDKRRLRRRLSIIKKHSISLY